MTYKEDVDKVIQKRQQEIDKLVKSIEKAEEKIKDKEDEIFLLNDVKKSLPAVQPSLADSFDKLEKAGATIEVGEK